MPRKNTAKFGLGYGWLLGENPGTEPLDELRLNFDCSVKTDFSCNPIYTSGLYYHYRGGTLLKLDGTVQIIPDGRILLPVSADHYIYRDNDGVVSRHSSAYPPNSVPLAFVKTNTYSITENYDMRPSNNASANIGFISNNDLLTSGSVQDALNQISVYLQNSLTNVMRTYTYEQLTPESTWTVNHGLNKYPNALVVDLLGNQIFAEIDFPTANTIIVTASEPIAGRLYLSYPAGSSGFIFEQINPTTQWLIQHTLTHVPAVMIIDNAGNELFAEVDYPSSNTIIVTFGEPVAGKAILT